MNTVPNRFFRAALVFFAIGVSLGMAMPIVEDMTLRPVHVHVNLLGFVAFFLYGIFYKLHPEAAATRLAEVHYWGALVGLPPMMIGLALVLYGRMEAFPLLMAGELVTVASVALFVAVGFRATRAPRTRAIDPAASGRPGA